MSQKKQRFFLNLPRILYLSKRGTVWKRRTKQAKNSHELVASIEYRIEIRPPSHPSTLAADYTNETKGFII